MTKPSLSLQEQQNMAQSRILFEQVMVDNQPTEQQVLERADQLQIDDLQLARESLTKELESFWRPYVNRYGDIYYVNLKQRTAYIQHPIDMETKILYAKRHKTAIPKYRSFQLEEISGSIPLIEQEIRKHKKTDLLRSTQSIPTQLNIVYEQSEQSNTERQQSQQSSQPFSDQEYIQNLQKSQQQNTRSRKSTPRQGKQSFNRGYKKFPSSGNNQYDNHSQESQEQLTPEYERMLIEYEEQVKKQHQKELKVYRQMKQDNHMKKQDLFRHTQKAVMDKHKFSIMAQFQTQLQEKNSHNLQKQTHKIITNYKDKLQHFQRLLHKDRLVLENLEESANAKHSFVQQLQSKMERRLNQAKHLMQEEITKEMYQIHFFSRISQINTNSREQFNKDSYKVIEQKLNELIRQKGVKTRRGQNLRPLSLTSFYEGILNQQFNKIDRVLLQNELGRQMRKRTKSIFNKKPAEAKAYESHIVFAESQKSQQSIKQKQRQKEKQNNMNQQNIVLDEKKHTIQHIESDILKSSQNNRMYYQRKNKIFGVNQIINLPKVDKSSKQPQQVITLPIYKDMPFDKYSNMTTISYGLDRKSIYLRMMKRIM